ncbi:MAG: ABC transporter substrate-binding protein [Propioniciclava sp.]|uniref:ABC transporter substrate-binding protein n=1 Tax=Propioniciclava sp. TaxID=2038686 RepID=UPI0039E518D0
MLKKIISPIMLMLFALFLTACSPAAPTSPSSSPSGSAAASAHYPVTITNWNYAGDEVSQTFTKAPEKVLAVYQGSIETMIALGLEDHVAASYGLDNAVKPEWQAGLTKMNYQEDKFAPDRETVTLLQPDFIFSWSSFFGEKTLGDVTNWQPNGTGTYINTNTRRGSHNRTIENEFSDILNIGKIFDVEAKAEALVKQMRDEIDSTLAAAKGQSAPKVAILEFLDGGTTNYGATSLGGDMVTRLGGTLAMPEVPKAGFEDIIAANPDVIFVVTMPGRGEDAAKATQEALDKVLKEPALASLDAVKNNRVVDIMLGDMYASGPRTFDGIKTFSAGMYPDLKK